MGKWLAAQEAVGDALALEVRDDPSIEHVRDVLGWLQMRPLAGVKVGLFDLDAISLPGHHAMLKVLEEPPAHARLVCVSSGSVLSTVWSRCHVVRFSELSRDEVCQALVGLGKLESVAQELSLVSGSVGDALAAEDMLAVRLDVMSYLGVLERHDRSSVWDIDEIWTRSHSRLLWRWCVEVSMGAPSVFRLADLDVARALGKMFIPLAQEVRSAVGFSPAAVALGLWRI